MMLILSRRIGEKIYIGDSVVITLVDVSPGRARIGIEAPRDISVHRSELVDGVAELEARKKQDGGTDAR